MKKHLIGAVAATAVLSPIAAMAKTDVHFWHAFTGRLGELVAAQVEELTPAKATTRSCKPTKETTPKR